MSHAIPAVNAAKAVADMRLPLIPPDIPVQSFSISRIRPSFSF
jgi:hypothetical protein